MGVPSLVRIATAHHVGACRIVLVPRSLVPVGCTCVVLVDLMTMGPVIIPWERLVCRAPPPHSRCRRRQCDVLVPSQSVHKLLVGILSKVTKAMSNRLAAVSC